MQHLTAAHTAADTNTDSAPQGGVHRKTSKLLDLHRQREAVLATGLGNKLWRGLLDQVTARGYVTRKKSIHLHGCRQAPVNGVLADVLVKDVPLRQCCTARLIDVDEDLSSFIGAASRLDAHRKTFERHRSVRRAKFYVSHVAERYRRELAKVAEIDVAHGFGLAPAMEKLLAEISLWERAVENEDVDVEVRVMQLARIAVGPSRDQDLYGTRRWRRMHVELGRRLGMRFDCLTDLFYGRVAELLENGVHRDAVPGIVFREAVLSRHTYRLGTMGRCQITDPVVGDYERELFVYEAAEHYLAAIAEEALRPVVFTSTKPHPMVVSGSRLCECHPEAFDVLLPGLGTDSGLRLVDVDQITREWMFRDELPVVDVASLRLKLRGAKTMVNQDGQWAFHSELVQQRNLRAAAMLPRAGWWSPER